MILGSLAVGMSVEEVAKRISNFERECFFDSEFIKFFFRLFIAVSITYGLTFKQ